jgi:hypothetical protein
LLQAANTSSRLGFSGNGFSNSLCSEPSAAAMCAIDQINTPLLSSSNVKLQLMFFFELSNLLK